MSFNQHYNLEGRHAFLSASKGSWTNYDDEKLMRVFGLAMTAQRGTELHELAKRCIKLGVKLPSSRKTLNMYVNDCIGMRMTPEQPVYYSENAFGTMDAASFRRNKFRVFDLKNGVTATSERQLEIYSALFCLEYNYKPFDIEIEMRIYQNNEVRIYEADPIDIDTLMRKIVHFDKIINDMKKEADL